MMGKRPYRLVTEMHPESRKRNGAWSVTCIKHKWQLVAVLVPFSVLPYVVINNTPIVKSAYVMIWMSVYWMLEVVPLPVTALLPVIFFPLLGIMDTRTTAGYYMNDVLLFVLASSIMSEAFNQTGFQKRIFIKFILMFGSSTRRILLAVMVVSMIMSSLVSSIAIVMIITPLLETVLSAGSGDIIAKHVETDNRSTEEEETQYVNGNSALIKEDISIQMTDVPKNRDLWQIPNMGNHNTLLLRKNLILLGMCYSAIVGGFATPSGSGFAQIFSAALRVNFPLAPEINYGQWTLFCFPLAVLCTLASWTLYQLLYRNVFKDASGDHSFELLRKNLLKEYESASSVKLRHIITFCICCLQVIACMTREFQKCIGWGSWMPGKVEDATPALAICFLFFIIPSNICHDGGWKPLLHWKDAYRKIPFDLLLTVGGGIALSAGIKVTGLSALLASKLIFLRDLHLLLTSSLICLFASALTEVMGNVSAIFVLMPVVVEMAISQRVHPQLYMLAVVISSNFSFMLPISNFMNIFLYDHCNIKVIDMAKLGIVMKIACLVTNFIYLNTLGTWFFDLNNFPSWAILDTSSSIVNSSSISTMP